MRKIAEVLKKRIAKIDERLLAMAEEGGEGLGRLKAEDAELEALHSAIYRAQAGLGTLSPEQEALKQKYGVTCRQDCQQKRVELQGEIERLQGPKMREAQRLNAEKKKLTEALPLIGMVESALADYLPLAKEVSAELSPELADVAMVFLDLFTKTGIEVWGRWQDQHAHDTAMLWARGLKVKLDALLEVGFAKQEAMQLILASQTSPANALLQGLKNYSGRVNVKK